MKTRSKRQQITDYILANDGFAVICHENPDGDALGSLLALTNALRRLGKNTTPACFDGVPYKYSSMPGIEAIQDISIISSYKNLITVDCADKERIGHDTGKYIGSDAFIINIDHHQSNTMFGNINYVDSKAASTAELVFKVIKKLDIPLDKQTAEYLMVAVSTDTGHFSYRNTRPETLRFASVLVAAGADVQQISNSIYKRRTEGMTRLIGRAIDNMRLYSGGRVAIMTLSLQDFEECGAEPADAEGLVEFARDIDTVEVAAIIRESMRGAKVSLRSKGDLDVAAIAQVFGGGGHKAAAGLYLQKSLQQAADEIKETLIGAL